MVADELGNNLNRIQLSIIKVFPGVRSSNPQIHLLESKA